MKTIIALAFALLAAPTFAQYTIDVEFKWDVVADNLGTP